MKKFCPLCEKETEQLSATESEEINIRGEMIPVEFEYQYCQECGEKFEPTRPDYDPLDNAYRVYRQMKGMVQPEEIKRFRKNLGLTQKEYSKILGIGIATLNRYENGALQSQSHDQIIQLSMQPANLRTLIENKAEILSQETRNRIFQSLKNEGQECGNLLNEAIEEFGSYPPDLFSGHIRFDINKFFQTIKFFCYKDQVVKTKLMKLLFYADFKHFRDYGTSITGARYAHAPHGPVPDNFGTWLIAISEWEKEIDCEEQTFGNFVGEAYTSEEPDWSIFSTSELAVLAEVKKEFQQFSGKQIRNFSHREDGYMKSETGELISYQYAQKLQI